ncbi:PKD domain-containing protein [Lignipirellula cremea]|uniref:PKD domain protein n=1 Tax=Lignipirellula cremea TaxID=2528010 RepID=A0A518E4P8_9BACT|nr:PKD domain-containing protein [Lignipirellula cremea]QDU99054.1 PKD domain protein [Lignipirellula cremea]
MLSPLSACPDRLRTWTACGLLLLLLLPGLASTATAGDVLVRPAQDTLTAVEMNHGDELQFRLKTGRVVRLELLDTGAAIVERVTPGGIVYRFWLDLRIDGERLTLERFVCSQECFYEPYVVNGLRIWPDMVQEVFDLVPVRYPGLGNLRCVPRKDARLAVQDATLRICPDPTVPWLDEQQNTLDVGRCYNGDDCYLGPYLGEACHVGLDLNHPKGSFLFAPIRFDTHQYFNSLERGDNNNRWRGIRRWPNGDVWALQTHHLIKLLTPIREPLAQGAKYASSAGVHVGSHEHTHYEFKIGRPRTPRAEATAEDLASFAWPVDFDSETEIDGADPEVLHLDPWIIFWQIFEDRKDRDKQIRAQQAPLAPSVPGQAVRFSAAGSRAGEGRTFTCSWTFGDGGFAIGPQATHTFAQPGVYPVTLIVNDGEHSVAMTQRITVSGPAVDGPVLALTAADEPSFRPLPAGATVAYGATVELTPHTLRILTRPTHPRPAARTLLLQNGSSARPLPPAKVRIADGGPCDWLQATTADVDGQPALRVQVDATGLREGQYLVLLEVDCPGALNSPQAFRVLLDVPAAAPRERQLIDDRDPGFFATPSFWVGHRFFRCPESRRGQGGFYRTNGARAEAGQFVRFTPDLQPGKYRVSLSKATPFSPAAQFDVRVKHTGGETIVRMHPGDSRTIGEFAFAAGNDGFVEILAAGSKGLVMADAVLFEQP